MCRIRSYIGFRAGRIAVTGIVIFLIALVGNLGAHVFAAGDEPAEPPSNLTWQEVQLPPGRSNTVTSFDDATRSLVVYGGTSSSSDLGDTWLWDERGWSEAFSPSTPGHLYDAGAVYDAVRRNVILFGGRSLTSLGDNRTWAWNGQTWQQLAPAHAPSARLNPQMAFDAASQSVVLFGGCCNDRGSELTDTWTWTGSDWLQQHPTTSPTNVVQLATAMAYDAATRTVVLYATTYGGESQTWTWDGRNWTQQFPPTSPPVRQWTAMAYDDANGTVVLFGGDCGPIYNPCNDTWTWNGTTWTKQTPDHSPPNLEFSALTFDKVTGSVVLVGGNAGNQSLDNIWSWNGTDWTQLNAAPSPRQFPSMVYDERSGEPILFGGLDRTGALGSDTWAWRNGVWWPLSPAHRPAARTAASMAYDAKQGVALLFGGFGCPADAGQCSAWQLLNDTWTFDGQDWRASTSRESPTARMLASMVFDPGNGHTMLFGGIDSSGRVLGDTWLWNGFAWAPREPRTVPSPRFGASLVYDRQTESALLFGGCADPQCDQPLSDTWIWDGERWTKQTPVLSPSPRGEASSGYDPTLQAVVLFGGNGGGGVALNDTWIWDGRAWTKLSPSNSPPSRYGATMVYDRSADELLLDGGTWPIGAAWLFR